MLVPPRAESLRRAWWRSPTLLLALATLIGIFALGWFSVLTRPAEAIAAVWWPASGLALGLGIRTPRKYLWIACVAVSVVLLGVNLAQYSTVPLGVAASVGAGVEMAIGTLILRAGVDSPRLDTYSDLAMLLLAVFAAATAYDLTVAITTLLTVDAQAAVAQLFSAGPRRAAGMLLVTPLFMELPRHRPLPRHQQRTRLRLSLIQLAVAVAVAVLVFVTNQNLPLAFLAIVPAAWGALTMTPRWLLAELLVIAGIASYGSATGSGPFSFARFGPTLASTLLQAFELTLVTIALVVAITVSREREAATNLRSSERVFRRNFETSLAGMLVAGRAEDGWFVERFNPAASLLLPQLADGGRSLHHLIGDEAANQIDDVLLARPAGRGAIEVQVADGRSFQMGVVPLGLGSGRGTIAVQLLDITDSLVARRQAAEEFERAGEVQRALSPAHLPTRAGWDHGAAAIPARQVGGDFYDLRIAGRFAVMTLGDVMGKGVGAGILAAAARTALRSSNPATRPGDALADSVRIVEDDLVRSGAFVTLGYATIDLVSGDVRLVDAGHGLSFVVRDGGDRVDRLATDDLPLGLGSDWSEVGTNLAPGDTLLMVSDGVLDRWGGSVAELMAAIAGLTAEMSVTSPQDLAEALCRRAEPDVESGDDATAVMIHRALPTEGSRS